MSLATTFLLAARQQEVIHLQALAHTCELVRRTASLIHQLQSERGATNLFLGAGDTRFLTQWKVQCSETNAALQHFEQILAREAASLAETGGSRLCICIGCALEDLSLLAALRHRTAQRDASPIDATAAYCSMIRRLITLIFEAVDAAAEPVVAKLLIALLNFIEGKEYCGIERALGSRILSSGARSESDQSYMFNLIEQQKQAFNRFTDFCDPATLQQWGILQNLLPIAEIETQRKIILQPITNAETTPDTWFQLCSERINRLHEVENHLANHLQQVCEQRVLEARQHQREISDSLLQPIVAEPAKTLPMTGDILDSRINRSLYDLLKTQAHSIARVNDELASVRASLDDRKRIERAKGLLMSAHGISEESAYNLMRQKAMNQKMRLPDVAQSVLDLSEQLTRRG